MAQNEVQATMFPARTAVTAAVLAVLLGLAGACWVVAIHQMNGMDMGTGTQLGSFGFFIAVWVAMMVAMMLPGAIPAVMRRANAAGGARAVPLFVGSYLAVWALAGVVLLCPVPAARDGGGRGSGDRGRALRADAAQAALPPALP